MDPDPGDEDDPVTQNGYTYADNNPAMMTDPDGHATWLVVNAGFALYDGYGAYRSGKSARELPKQPLWVLLAVVGLNMVLKLCVK